MEDRKSIKNAEYVTTKGRFTLRNFIKNYIESSVFVAGQNLTVEKYDEEIRKRVSDTFKYGCFLGQGILSLDEVGLVSIGEVLDSDIQKIERPLYWGLVGNSNGHPLEYVQGKEPGEASRIYLRNGLDEDGINELTDKFLEGKVGEHVDIRIRKALLSRFEVDL
ncbi:hypothetical protein HOE04_05395 [archaeon]|jgi:hypothetical protein|nr:hypothetical protein [archaeon]